MSDHDNSSECAVWLKALGEPTRLQIVRLLLIDEHSVTMIAETLDLEIATVSHHLRVLLHAGLVYVVKDGRFSVYRINPDLLRRGSSRAYPTLDFGCCKFQMNQTE